MSVKIADLKEDNGKMTFTISGIDVSYANALRRTIISNIPIIVFKTLPYEENKADIKINTPRFHNEVVKQRLSCIPICVKDIDKFPIKNYVMELDVENNTDTIMIVTTKDFKIRDLVSNNYLDDGELKKIFPPYIPPDGNGEYYIDFLRLRPRLSDEIPGERIKLSCQFSIGTAQDDGMFNVTGTCSYGFTPDYEKIEEQLAIRKQKWKDEDITETEIQFLAKNWKLLDGMRYVKKNSFDFIIESVGIYENEEIVTKACDIVIEKLEILKNQLSEDTTLIKPSDNTLENSYDITLQNEDYTIGNILNNEIYRTFYTDLKVLNYVGFKKMHPHDDDSILRFSFEDKTKGLSHVQTILKTVIQEAIKTLNNIKQLF
jgi:DNA-directed RNA polymerase subunit L